MFDEDLVGKFPAVRQSWLSRYVRLILLVAFAANILTGLVELFLFRHYGVGLFNFVLGAGVPLLVFLKTKTWPHKSVGDIGWIPVRRVDVKQR